MAENELNKHSENGFSNPEHHLEQQLETPNSISSVETTGTVEEDQLNLRDSVEESIPETTYIQNSHIGTSSDQVRELQETNEAISGSDEEVRDKKAEADLFEHGAKDPREILENLLR